MSTARRGQHFVPRTGGVHENYPHEADAEMAREPDDLE